MSLSQFFKARISIVNDLHRLLSQTFNEKKIVVTPNKDKNSLDLIKITS